MTKTGYLVALVLILAFAVDLSQPAQARIRHARSPAGNSATAPAAGTARTPTPKAAPQPSPPVPAPAPVVSGTPAKSPGPLDVTLGAWTAGAKTLPVFLHGEAEPRQLTFKDPAIRAKLADALKCDKLRILADDVADPHVITGIDRLTRPVTIGQRLIALGGAILALTLAAGLVTRWRPQRFLIGVDNRYSNSQCQLALWFGAVASIYAAAVALRIVLLGPGYIGGVGLPANLIALTGLSAFTFGGAKVITNQKVDAAARDASQPRQGDAAGQAPQQPLPAGPAPQQPLPAAQAPQRVLAAIKPPAARANIVRDLVNNDKGQADLGDFQMILVALAAVAIFVAQAFTFLGGLELAHTTMLPDVDSTLLAGFGLGQGAYLVKKAAMKPGEG